MVFAILLVHFHSHTKLPEECAPGVVILQYYSTPITPVITPCCNKCGCKEGGSIGLDACT